jgi:dTDP-4-amino-4,6-dideoxygalactose transaminase
VIVPRRQLPVYSPVRFGAVARGAGAAIKGDAAQMAPLRQALRDRYSVADVILTDCGTSALVMALRLLAGDRGRVALPGYSCIDLTAAALRANVSVRLYDVDPATLSADLTSLEHVLREGVDAVAVAHLFGYPMDMSTIAALASHAGATLIDDAAQSAGATLGGALIGRLGNVGVLSFGRGKGTTGGSGGALLVRDQGLVAGAQRLAEQFAAPARGWGDILKSGFQIALGRPSLYALPLAIPWLRLGEMVYHPAREPASISVAASRMVRDAMAWSDAELGTRRANAARLHSMALSAGVRLVETAPGAVPGYLRFPVLVPAGSRRVDAVLGITAAYPRTLAEQHELQPQLLRNQAPVPGADELRRCLVTLPTHSRLSASDLDQIGRWLRSAGGQRDR